MVVQSAIRFIPSGALELHSFSDSPDTDSHVASDAKLLCFNRCTGRCQLAVVYQQYEYAQRLAWEQAS